MLLHPSLLSVSIFLYCILLGKTARLLPHFYPRSLHNFKLISMHLLNPVTLFAKNYWNFITIRATLNVNPNTFGSVPLQVSSNQRWSVVHALIQGDFSQRFFKNEFLVFRSSTILVDERTFRAMVDERSHGSVCYRSKKREACPRAHDSTRSSCLTCKCRG